MVRVARPFYKLWFRSEVRGLDKFPSGGALIVSNHSGGSICMGRADLLGRLLREVRLRPSALHPRPRHPVPEAGHRAADANGHDPRHAATTPRRPCARARRSSFSPAGPTTRLRPTWEQSTIDFGGRTGYVTTAIEAGVPIVPAVSIGGQETQLFLTRGTWLAKRLGLKRLARLEEMPVSHRVPVRAEHRSASTFRFRPRSSPRSWSRSTSPPSSARTPTLPRSTRTFAR